MKDPGWRIRMPGWNLHYFPHGVEIQAPESSEVWEYTPVRDAYLGSHPNTRRILSYLTDRYDRTERRPIAPLFFRALHWPHPADPDLDQRVANETVTEEDLAEALVVQYSTNDCRHCWKPVAGLCVPHDTTLPTSEEVARFRRRDREDYCPWCSEFLGISCLEIDHAATLEAAQKRPDLPPGTPPWTKS